MAYFKTWACYINLLGLALNWLSSDWGGWVFGVMFNILSIFVIKIELDLTSYTPLTFYIKQVEQLRKFRQSSVVQDRPELFHPALFELMKEYKQDAANYLSRRC